MPTNGHAVPPQSAATEQALLGALLINPSLWPAVSVLAESDFHLRQHRVIFRAASALAGSGAVIDVVSVGEWLVRANLAEQAGDDGYLIDLASNTPGGANLAGYVKTLREKSSLRRLMDAGAAVAEAATSGEGSADDIYARGLSLLAKARPVPTDDRAPIDLFGEFVVPPLQRDWLPPAIADFVFEASAVKGSPPEVLALSALVTCAAALHDLFQVQPKPNEPRWRESARLWGLIIGDPSAKKSPPMKLAVHALDQLNKQCNAKFLDESARYARDLRDYTATEKVRSRAEARGDGMPSGAEAPAKPANIRTMIDNSTIEKLADLMADNPRGLLLKNDELSSWFCGMDAYSKASGRDRGYWLRFYDGGSLMIDRMTRESTMVENASVSIIGGIQPDKIRTLVSKMDDDGLMQRFIVAVIPTQVRRATDDVEPDALIRAYDDIVGKIYRLIPGANTTIAMSPEAAAIQADLFRWVETLVGSDALPTMFRSHLTKWQAIFPRLCLTYHAIACAAGGAFITAKPITEATARRVDAFMRQWMLPNAFSFYTGISCVTPTMHLAKAIASWVLANRPSHVTVRSLQTQVSSWRSAPDWQQRSAVALLEQGNWLLPAPLAVGERVPTDWAVNPRVWSDFAERAAKAEESRHTVGALLAQMRAARTAERVSQ